MIYNIIFFTLFFSFSHNVLDYFSIKGIYYFNHVIANLYIIYKTYKNVIRCYSDDTISNYSNADEISIVYSIHFYHILYFFHNLRFNDWLHHILMVFVCLPLTHNLKYPNLINHTLFFLTGLPGCIDYLLLFLVRNDILVKHTEKYCNVWINLWIRCPGCISSSTLILKEFGHQYQYLSIPDIISMLIIAILVYWNGIYFMFLTVQDYVVRYKKIEKINS